MSDAETSTFSLSIRLSFMGKRGNAESNQSSIEAKNQAKCVLQHKQPIGHFTAVCLLVAWPLNKSEAGVDLVLIETSLLFLCKFKRTASFI